MKKTCVLLSVLIALNGWGLECHYTQNHFEVISEGKTYSQNVRPGFLEYKKACGESLAALYDGDSVTVFDADQKNFDSKIASPDYPDGQVMVNGPLASLTDGGGIWIYDATLHRFISQEISGWRVYRMSLSKKAAAFYDGDKIFRYHLGLEKIESSTAPHHFFYAKLEVADSVIAFYDGDSWKIWSESKKEEVTDLNVNPNYKFAKEAVLSSGALLYDGREWIGYCLEKDRSIRENAPKDADVRFEKNPLGNSLIFSDGTKKGEFRPKECQFLSVTQGGNQRL